MDLVPVAILIGGTLALLRHWPDDRRRFIGALAVTAAFALAITPLVLPEPTRPLPAEEERVVLQAFRDTYLSQLPGRAMVAPRWVVQDVRPSSIDNQQLVFVQGYVTFFHLPLPGDCHVMRLNEGQRGHSGGGPNHCDDFR